MKIALFFVLLIALLAGGGNLRAAAAPTTEEAVAYLIKRVETSKLTFIRNGSEHGAAEAAQLMRRKYDYAKKEVHTPEDFIRLAGTESHLSGKPYLVKMPDGKTVPSAQWLNAALRDFRANAAK